MIFSQSSYTIRGKGCDIVKHDKNTPIPRATAKRLSLYYRIFKRFNSEKIERANSKQIADAIGIDSATVRRDFSYFGELGRRGFGYDVKKLMNFFADLLNDNAITNVAIVGIGNMGSAVHKHAVENGYSVVREIGGHGVGVEFHEDPWVSFVSEENTGVLMVPGMMFTIEPMVNMGSDEIYTDEIDEWTVRTEDGLPSAQWEVTVLVTETGCEVICW